MFKQSALRRGVEGAAAESSQNIRHYSGCALVAADVHGESLEFLVRSEVQLYGTPRKFKHAPRWIVEVTFRIERGDLCDDFRARQREAVRYKITGDIRYRHNSCR